MTHSLDTPGPYFDLLDAAEAMRLLDRREDGVLLEQFTQRRELAKLLGAPLPVDGTAREAIAFERTQTETVPDVMSRVLATLSAAMAPSAGNEELGYARGDGPLEYLGDSVWRRRDGDRDRVFVRLAFTNGAAVPLSQLDVVARFVAADGTGIAAFGCFHVFVRSVPGRSYPEPTPVAPGADGIVLCDAEDGSAALPDFPELTAAVQAGSPRIELRVATLQYQGFEIGYEPNATSDHGREIKLIRPPPNRWKPSVFDRLRSSSCIERGVCGTEIGGALGMTLPWIVVGALALGALTWLARVSVYLEPPPATRVGFSLRTAVFLSAGVAAGLFVALEAPDSAKLSFLPIPAGALVGFALASAAHLVTVSLLFSILQLVALLLVAALIGDSSDIGMGLVVIFGLVFFVIMVPGTLLAICLGIAVLAAGNLRTRLCKFAIIAGIGAPLVLIGAALLTGL